MYFSKINATLSIFKQNNNNKNYLFTVYYQGDPLSYYLFILGHEILSIMLDHVLETIMNKVNLATSLAVV